MLKFLVTGAAGQLGKDVMREVVFAVVRNGSIQILANGHAPWLLSHQLEVDTQFCVWVESLSCFT